MVHGAVTAFLQRADQSSNSRQHVRAQEVPVSREFHSCYFAIAHTPTRLGVAAREVQASVELMAG